MIFLWVTELLNKLKLEEIEWKRENGFLEEIMPEPEPDQKDENQEDKKDCSDSEHERHNDDEEDKQKRKLLKQLTSITSIVEDEHPYPPLQNLKQTVKDRMLKLA